MDRIAALLLSSGDRESHLPATILYNEGWLLRVVLDWFSRQPPSSHPLGFHPGARWYTEALLPSQFRARKRGDDLAEARTHADGVIGHFSIGDSGKGDLMLLPDAQQFVVVEAKLFSGLSSGTKRALQYDQAARNVACMAEVVAEADIPPEQLQTLRFVVLAPEEQIAGKVFGSLVTSTSILEKVRNRAAAYAGDKDAWCQKIIEPFLDRVALDLLSWESVLATVKERDDKYYAELFPFYSKCLEHNRPRRRDFIETSAR